MDDEQNPRAASDPSAGQDRTSGRAGTAGQRVARQGRPAGRELGVGKDRNSALLSVRAERGVLWIGTLLGAALAAVGIVWMLAPHLGAYTAGISPMEQVLPTAAGTLAAAAIQTIAGVVTVVIGIGVLRGAPAGAAATGTAVALGLVTLIGLVGFNGLAFAGYSFAFLLPVIALVLIAVALVRRPLTGLLLTVIAAGVAAFAVLGPVPLLGFFEVYLRQAGGDPVQAVTHSALIAHAGLWLLWGAAGLVRSRGAAGDAIVRHRTAITALAAACALPYVIARASWLTPWPLFGGSAELFDADPATRAIGLMLGAAMLAGGVLTLGLVMPWGRRFPRWLGGGPVPVALAVVPASVAAALFTGAGVQIIGFAFASATLPVDAIAMILVLPFWLWGPLLGLATWAYARSRADETATASGPVRTA